MNIMIHPKHTSLYTDPATYENGPEGMNNEVRMFYAAGSIFLQQIIQKSLGTKFGGLHGEKSDTLCLMSKQKVLDLCCGPGTMGNYLQLFYSNFEYTGIDTNKSFCDYGLQKYGDLGWNFLCEDAVHFKGNASYNFVIASSAYHHILDSNKAVFLRTIAKNLESNGIAIICENFLPEYADSNARVDSVEIYYQELKRYYAQGGATQKSLELIAEVEELEKAGVEEHKVDYKRFEGHVASAGLRIRERTLVWQPDSISDRDCGSQVLVLGK
jgi:SAM-dependent methyltransferase